MEGMGLKFTPLLVRLFLGPPGLSGGLALLGLIAIVNSPNGRYNLPPAAHPLSPLSRLPTPITYHL